MRTFLPLSALWLCACEPGSGPNLFSIEEDKQLGLQVRDEILADPATYPVIAEADAPEAYQHLRRIRDEVFASGEVQNADRFDWEVYLIDDNETLNAFAAPGGYLFFYTGLINYLDEEDHFAGVMGHEIAHAGLRHSSKQLTQQYGVTTLLEVVFGNDQGGVAGEIAQGLTALRFSREDEAQSDLYSVIYLCDGPKAANGAAGFFEKIAADGGASPPEFLSSHPSSESRVEDIHSHAEERECNTTLDPNSQWAAFRASLP